MPVVKVALRMWFAVVVSLVQVTLQSSQIPGQDQQSRPAAQLNILGPAQYQEVRISQVYGGGDQSGSPIPCDYVELFNSSPQKVSLAGWSVQYRSYPGPAWIVAKLGIAEIEPYAYFLLAATCSVASYPWDLHKSIWMSTERGKVALVSKEAPITGSKDPAVVDFVGYGEVDDYEGSAHTPDLSPQTAAIRRGAGCTDTDNNGADFTVGDPAPRNSGSPRAEKCPDFAPRVKSSTPTDNAANVARSTNVVVTFSEPVTVSGNWFEIRCDLSGLRDAQSAAVTGEGASYTIDPQSDFLGDDTCRVTIFANGISDTDTDDPPDTPAADHVFDFKTEPGQCGEPAYSIDGIQGTDPSSPVAGKQRTVEGIVTGDFQGANGLSGFFVQQEPTKEDEDPLTSEAIFVDEHIASLGDMAAGTRVRVAGIVNEASGLTSLTNVSSMIGCGPAELPPSAPITLPLGASETWEQYEGMLVRFEQQLTVSDGTTLAKQGQLTLVAGGVAHSYTQAHAPDAAGWVDWEDNLAGRTILLDDRNQSLYPDPIRYPSPGLSASNTIRVGDVVEAGMTGIADFRNGLNMIQPVNEPVFLQYVPRTPAPVRAGGNVRAVFMSLGDYFNVAGTAAGGPRGASSAEEFTRQRDKIIAALLDLNADVIGVSKVENDGYGTDAALLDLVNGLNEKGGGGTYTFVDPQRSGWGSDVVAVAIVYRASTLVPIGGPAMLDTGAFSQDSPSPVHRAPISQTFEEKTWGERFTVVVNEWHGRGDCPASGVDADAGGGQGCWNAARTGAAQDLAAWLGTDPTSSGDPDVLILGELNAFPKEDPIQALISASYTDLVSEYVGTNSMTISLNGRAGASDYGLASPSLDVQIVGTSVWGINAEEPPALDYQLENKATSQQTSLYAPDAYRSSDQNPVAVDLNLLPDLSDLSGSYGTAWHTGQGVWRLGNSWSGEDDGVTTGTGNWNDGQGEITVSVNGPAGEYGCLYGWFDFSDGDVQAGVVDEPDGDWDPNEEVITGVPLSPGERQPFTFELPAGSIKSDAALNMRLRLIPAPDRSVPGCTISALRATQNVEPGSTGRADGGEVEDVSITTSPLAVDMSSFSAHVSGNQILVAWETTSEDDVAGFNLYRMNPNDGAWTKINDETIASQTPGASQANRYEWMDRNMMPDALPVYRLEELRFEGASTFYGPIEVATGVPTAVKLSQLRGDAQVGIVGPAGVFVCLALAGILLFALRVRPRCCSS